MCARPVAHSCLTLCRPHEVQPTRLLCLWDSPGKNTGVGCHFLLQGIFLTQGLNPQSFPSPAITRRAGRFLTTSATHKAQDTEEGKEGGSQSLRDPGRIQGGKWLKS